MKGLNYFICLTTILCSCNNELPFENVQETQDFKNQEESSILRFNSTEEFLSTIENFNLENPIIFQKGKKLRILSLEMTYLGTEVDIE